MALTTILSAQTGGSPQAQDGERSQDAPTFRVNAHLAVTDVVVTDKRGVLIHGLIANDFHVFENGVEQKIASFEEHTGSAGWAPAPEGALPPDTYTNATRG